MSGRLRCSSWLAVWLIALAAGAAHSQVGQVTVLPQELLPIELVENHERFGGEIEGQELSGSFVLLDFWATWCAPCLAELPNLRRLWQLYGERELVLVSVSLDTLDRRELRRFLGRHEISWPQVHDGRAFDGALARHFGVETVPRTMLLDRQGRLIALDLRGEVLSTVLRDLIEANP